MEAHGLPNGGGFTAFTESMFFSRCAHCAKVSFWFGTALVFPATSPAPAASPDLPADVAADYTEAATVVVLSPRAACALLRLALQKLCVHLGEPGKNINDDIGALVEKGLPGRFQKALDVVRVVGNNAVHPGELDLTDDQETALKLFGFLNLLADATITQPKNVDALFDSLPERAKDGIKKRDG